MSRTKKGADFLDVNNPNVEQVLCSNVNTGPGSAEAEDVSESLPVKIRVGGKVYKPRQLLARLNGETAPAIYWGMYKKGDCQKPVVLDNGKFVLLSKEEFLKRFK